MARTHGHGNPKWTREETILALELYLKYEGNIPSRVDEKVEELSALLRSLPHYGPTSRMPSFRNLDSVRFKLQNLRQVATGKGLGNVSETDRQIWKEFSARPEAVHSLAKAIRTGATALSEFKDVSGVEEEEFPEGRVLTRLHMVRERDRRLRSRLLQSRRAIGVLTCDMCACISSTKELDFEEAMFEIHHLIPLAAAAERTTRLQDLALLCANCHRLMHRAILINKSWLDISQARSCIFRSDAEPR